ncbi:MAG: hypothetical protein HOI95_18700 [Chromatiales bacterium]|jgi:hypothetical protein|nr:hypothetical protein [Chromatiales bacterium]
MAYTIKGLANDCRQALSQDDGLVGRERVRDLIACACADEDFVASHLGESATKERDILYEDADYGFCIIAHVYKGEKHSNPHDHGPSWAIYGQAAGTTTMTNWDVLSAPAGAAAGKVKAAKTYELSPGDAYLYDVGDVHSPSRDGETRLLRVEGMNMDTVTRDKYEVA